MCPNCNSSDYHNENGCFDCGFIPDNQIVKLSPIPDFSILSAELTALENIFDSNLIKLSIAWKLQEIAQNRGF